MNHSPHVESLRRDQHHSPQPLVPLTEYVFGVNTWRAAAHMSPDLSWSRFFYGRYVAFFVQVPKWYWRRHGDADPD